MVLVGAGGVDHDELVKLAEKNFSGLPVSSNPIKLGQVAHGKSDFVGSEVRVRDDTMPTAHIAIAVEGVSWSSPDYFPMLVMQSILGNWDRALGASPLLSSKLVPHRPVKQPGQQLHVLLHLVLRHRTLGHLHDNGEPDEHRRPYALHAQGVGTYVHGPSGR